MTDDTRTIVTEDWQYDAIRVIIHNPRTQQVASVHTAPGTAPILKMRTYAMGDTEGQEEVGIRLPYAIARDLYDALGRHFGDRPDPGSRELVDALKAQAYREGERVDRLLDYALAPPMILPSMTATVHGDQG